MDRRDFIKGGAGALGLSVMARPGSSQPADARNAQMTIRITLSSVYVDDQGKALEFYTKKLGFVKKQDVPVGQYRWLTVVSPHEPDGTELLLEPTGHPASKVFTKALFDDGIPLTAFGVSDIQREFERLKAAGVRFKTEPTKAGDVTIAVFDDTCGNYIQLYQP